MAEIQTIEDVLYMYTTPLELPHWWSNHVFFETEKLGVVVYDIPFLEEDAKILWELIQKHTSGNISLIIVSHGHPDHWASSDFFKKVAPKATILMAKETAAYIDITGKANIEWAHRTAPQQKGLPTKVIEPTEVFDKEKVIDAGDLTLRLYTTGPAEDTEHTVLYIPELKVILPNDVIYNKYHLWNEEERDGHWLRIIDWLRTFDAKTVIPGHGPVSGPELYDVNEKWLTMFQDLRAKYAGKYSIKDMPPENRKKMIAEFKAAFPDWVEGDIEISCGNVLCLPYSFGENKYSVAKF